MCIRLHSILIAACLALSFSALIHADNYLNALEQYRIYNFPEAEKIIKNSPRSGRNKLPEEEIKKLDELSEKIQRAQRLYEHAEKITVIDSISVPASEFLEHIKLPLSAGRILPEYKIPSPLNQYFSMAYSNEAGDFMFLSENLFSSTAPLADNDDSFLNPDSIAPGIHQSYRLTDGKWAVPSPLPDEIKDMQGIFPFLTSDGTLLYFASDDPNQSIGGYDLFIASRDPSDDSYLEPSNLGLPFNSPYNDYMLAIDEENGVGWLVTDRNQLQDRLTIYIYLLPRERTLIGDVDDKRDLALLSNYKLTWGDNADPDEYQDLLDKILNIDPDADNVAQDFYLPMPGGRVFTLFSDFSNPQSESIMEQYIDLKLTQDDELEQLDNLRRQYHRNHRDRSVATRILSLEKSTESRRKQLKRLLSDIYRLETKYR